MQILRALPLILFFTLTSSFATVGFKLSTAGGVKQFLLWQAAANLTSFLGVLALSWVYKTVPVHIAYPLSQALVIISIQIVVARLVFREAITPWQWAGTAFILVGILLVTMQAKS
jgi:multidrug transporter EmrE-like cation transporter